MRDRNVIAMYVVGVVSLVGAIVLYNNSDYDAPDSQGSGPSSRAEGTQGVIVDLALPESFFKREQPEASGPVSRATTPPEIQTSRSAAGGAAPVAAAQTTLVSAAPACNQSLLASVMGLLGALLGGGGGC